ncbi:hypothetical protein [Hyphomicrobium sp.]|uniref:hypothetical protein n=1 Tax=Hyphomicrobium sp. TaxID=82 RepID=UPI002E36F439|nr:hypothetical protein [Hyphomicrobium sp.]HEX2840395.1 hypothetical protein [Hyphomicrobium sp.]
MSKIFALLAVALIATGLLVLAVPREEGSEGARSLSPQSVSETPAYLLKARDLAEQVNAPLSILFGLVSLYYSRRSYHINKARAETERGRTV